MNRSIHRLYLTLAGGFGLLVLLLGYWQVVAAPGLNERDDNVQAAQRERLIDRGRILSADGRVLAASRARRIEGQRVFERIYPQGALAAHVVGYASADAKTGLEDAYDRFLSGSFGTEPLLQRLNLREKRGANVITHLDSRVQRVAQDGLSGSRGAVVALDPRTGAVLAMASAPGFDPGQVLGNAGAVLNQSGAPLLNRASAGRYPPGSTFKVVTATAALESDLGFTADQAFDDVDGSYDTPGGPIRNFGGQTFGTHTFTSALTRSINTTFASIGDILGAERLLETMASYGFGERPPIDLPDEEVAASGRYANGEIIENPEEGIDTARIAIGQEQLLATPLAMAMVAGAIANQGTVMAPQLLDRVVDRGGSVVRRGEPQEVGQAMSADSAATLTAMMTNVVNEGTGTAAALSGAGVTVAGKTGTAESGDAARNQAWFIGFAPADDPVVAVAVVIEDTSSTGGTVAAPIAAQVMQAAIEASGE